MAKVLSLQTLDLLNRKKIASPRGQCHFSPRKPSPSPPDSLRPARSVPNIIAHPRPSFQPRNSLPTLSTSEENEELETMFHNLDTLGDGFIPVSSLQDLLSVVGFHPQIIDEAIEFWDKDGDAEITCEEFLTLNQMKSDLVKQGLLQKLVIHDFLGFSNELDEIYDRVKQNLSGKCGDLSFISPEDQDGFGVAFCSVDGQFWHRGDSSFLFTALGGSFPVMYSIAMEEVGRENLTKVVGQEPGGQGLSSYVLDKSKRPLNPMISLGAVATASLIYPDKDLADRFDGVMDVWNKLTNSKVHFDNFTFLKDSESNDKKYSLAYYAKSLGGFDGLVNAEALTTELRFHFMCSSLQVSVQQMAVLAATLAKGGVNPLSNKRVFSQNTIRDCLSLMFSCGVRDGSGKFAFETGLPSKTGTSGLHYMVIPDFGGLAIWSPKLNEDSNSVRGWQFCREFADHFSLHTFNSRLNTNSGEVEYGEINPRDTYLLISSAANGSLDHVISLIKKGVDVNSTDYGNRTALHLAVGEKRYKVIEYLLRKGAQVDIKDRNGISPLDSAGKDQIILNLIERSKKWSGEEEASILRTDEKKEKCRYCGK